MKAPNSITIGNSGAPHVVFGHGWGRSHRDFIPVAEALAPVAHCVLLDLPGFGDTPRPEGDWGTGEYADYLYDHVTGTLGIERFVWVGHSFGGRIGLRMGAAARPALDALVIVAGAGVPRRRSALARLKGRIRSARFKAARKRARSEDEVIALEKEFGSPDYVASREMGLRDIFVRTVAEDQSADLGRITCPTTLIYGALDTETPPEVGRAIHAGIAGSEYVECPHFDHISILDRGRHQIALAIKEKLAGQGA